MANKKTFMSKVKKFVSNLPQLRNKIRAKYPSYKVGERFLRTWAIAFVMSGAYYKITGDMSLLTILHDSAMNGLYAGAMASVDKFRGEYLPSKK